MTTKMVDKFGTGAVRSSDADDVRYDLISPIALEEIARTYKEGADRYGDHNWLKGFPVSDLLNHAIRHVYLFLGGDRSEPHLPHAAWGLMAAIHSHKCWPHLNGNLCGPGCVPPAAALQECGEEDEDDNEPVLYGPEPLFSILPSETADESEIAQAGRLFEEIVKEIGTFPGGRNERTRVVRKWRLDEAAPEPRPHRIPAVSGHIAGRTPAPVVYLSGPMSGIPEFNFPAFNLAAEKLRQKGYPVLNPADFGADPKLSWAECLKRDLIAMLSGGVQLIVRLPGWELSRGASLENLVAERLGIGAASLAEILDFP